MAATGTKNARANQATKRKSTETTEQSLKKLKVAKSADRPLPVKSALKKSEKSEKPSKSAATTSQQSVDDNISSIKQSNGKKSTSKTSKTKQIAEPTTIAPADELEITASDDDDEALTADQTAELIAGFSSSEDEDEDEDEEDEQSRGKEVKKLPKAPISAALAKSLKQTADNDEASDASAIIYIGRVPHGFFEHQMQAYFSQFGEIKHLRLARSKKNNASKHYAFIEFASSEVAGIVAKTMDKYLLFNHILQVRIVPKEHVKDTMWEGAGKRRKVMPRNRIERSRLNKGTDKAGWEQRIAREKEKRSQKADKLKEIGYDFDMPDVKSVGAIANDAKAADQQLLQDVQQAADDAEDKIAEKSALKGSSKKRAAATANGEKNTKKSKTRSKA